jgi:hypothetical protein
MISVKTDNDSKQVDYVSSCILSRPYLFCGQMERFEIKLFFDCE